MDTHLADQLTLTLGAYCSTRKAGRLAWLQSHVEPYISSEAGLLGCTQLHGLGGRAKSVPPWSRLKVQPQPGVEGGQRGAEPCHPRWLRGGPQRWGAIGGASLATVLAAADSCGRTCLRWGLPNAAEGYHGVVGWLLFVIGGKQCG